MKMLNKKDIIDILNKYGLSKDKYIVISGAAMVMYGIKESTRDIDIYVSEHYYDYLLSNFNCSFERVNEFGHDVYLIDDVINFGCDYCNGIYNEIDGIRVQTVEEIIKLKEYLHRKKDAKDLMLIKDYLSKK